MNRFSAEDQFNDLMSFDILRGRYLSPFKPRAPTPPRSKETSPKPVQRHIKYRTSSVDSGVFVLRIPFDSVNCVNNLKFSDVKKRRNKNKRHSVHRERNSSLERFYDR